MIDRCEKAILKLPRNEFETAGKFQMPVIKKQFFELKKIELMSFILTKHKDDKKNLNKTVHFFTYDHRFDFAYTHPEKAL